MTQLVALLSSGKGSWAHVSKLARDSAFNEIVLLTNDFGKQHFTPSNDTYLIEVDFSQPAHVLVDEMVKKLRPIVKGADVACNFISGDGKEHMALLSALLKLGVGIRLVVSGENGFEEL